MHSVKKFVRKSIFGSKIKRFDPDFYLNHYDDLREIKGSQKALNHYIKYGKAEGRFPNEQAYLEHAESASSELRAGFDPVAYRFYNNDLQHRFETEKELFRHYLKHGHKEGRLCRFPGDQVPEAVLPEAEKWKSIFSVAEFLAWCGNELDALPSSREETLRIFDSKGVEEIWPVNFEYRFDVDFIRYNRVMPDFENKSDEEMYKAWIAKGFSAGIAPNEQIFLAAYLGGMPFPLSFNWQAFVRKSGMAHATTRSQALVALFNESARNIIRNIHLMGADAAWLLSKIGQRAMMRGDYRKAIALLVRSVGHHPTAETLTLLGDAHRARGAMAKALESYLASTDIDRAPMSAFCHAATIYASHQEFSQAFAVLRKGFPAWRQNVAFSDKLHEIVQLYFDHQSARAHALYKNAVKDEADLTVRREADDLLTETLNEIRAIYSEMESFPAPTGGSPDGYVAILANDDLRQCTHYRIEQKAFQFESAGIAVRIFSHSDVQGFIDSLIGARAAIFYRVAAVPPILRAILHANSMKLDTYYEVDDLIFDSSCYPDPYASFEGQISATEYAGLQFGVPLFRYAMAMCKGSIASTPALAERMQLVTATGASIVIRNGLDKRNNAAIRIGESPIRRENGRVRLFYGSGTKAHNADFNRLAGSVLIDLMQSHPQLDLVIVGHLKLGSELSELGDRIITYPVIPDVTEYWSLLASCDINLAVLEPGLVADCKSEIKWLEAAVLQIPSVVSGTKTYREAIENGVDGFIADTETEWRDALHKLVAEPHLRRRIGANARATALRTYRLEAGAQTLKSVFDNADRHQSQRRPGSLRVLICNVFFAPQSYGGATRVVEDNVRRFVDQYPDLEIGVFCSDEGATPPGRLSLGSENGIPIYRLSTPQEIHMDRRPFNEDHAAPFMRALDHFQPDIIHFHCVQRLSATLVEVALERAVPYLVTLHDAWWISDHQFLVDEDGLLRREGADILTDCAHSNDPPASIARRQRLRSLLQNSEGNLSVSVPFATVYEEAGIDKLRVVENGAPRIDSVTHSPRSDGRVALGHLGGRSAHKGAALIEAALRRGQFKNLHLTMVDGTLAPGQAVDTIWGTTPVTLTAPFAQSQVSQIYGKLDVLLAPSTWPESFGLVTREALDCGLRVVASDLGAIGQDIENGRNGWVIDVTTTEGLSNALSRIDADPEGYRMRLPRTGERPRGMAEQAADLHALYHEVASARRRDVGAEQRSSVP